MINSNYLSTPGLKDFQGSRNPVAVAWDITDPTLDTSNPLFKDGDYGIYLPTGTPLLPETRPLVYRFKKDVPIVPGSSTINLWLPPNVYAGNPEVLAYLIGTETGPGLMAQGWSPTPIGLGGSISSVGGWIRLNSPSSLDAASLICTESILFSEEFYFRGDVRGQFINNGTTEAGFFHTLPPGVTPTQFAVGKINTQPHLHPLVRGTATWSVFPSGATNKTGVAFEPNNTWSMEFNSYDRITTSTRLLYSTTINGVTYATARRGTAANVASDPFNLDIRVTAGTVGTPTRIDLKNFFVLRF